MMTYDLSARQSDAGCPRDSSYLRNQHTVTLSYTHRHANAIFAQGTGSNGEDLGLIELFDTGLGQEDAAGRFSLGLDALDEDAVQQGNEGLYRSDRGSLYRRQTIMPLATVPRVGG